MVLLSASVKLNQWLGPALLKWGIRARIALARGVLRDQPWADALCGITIAQKLIQVEVHDETKVLVRAAMQKKTTPTRTPNEGLHERNNEEDEEEVIRLRVLERYLRPALVPTEQWSDVRSWQFHSRLQKWLRSEYLIAKHGASIRAAFQTFPVLRQSPQLGGGNGSKSTATTTKSPANSNNSNLLSTNSFLDLFTTDKIDQVDDGSSGKLPHSTLVTKAFGMSQWNPSKDIAGTRADMVRIAEQLNGSVVELRGGNVAVSFIPDNADLSQLSLGDILEIAGCHVLQCGPLNALCEEADIYQFWTRDYVEQLGRYLLKRSLSFDSAKETVILDVGAGDGVLAQLLRDFLDKERASSSVGTKEPFNRKKARDPKGKRVNRTLGREPASKAIPIVVASDDGTWGISPLANVECRSVQEAVETYASDANDKHVIVLCSWMPMNEDWTSIFRKHRVKEYILIGECDDGQCGDNWKTWSNPNHLLEDFPDPIDDPKLHIGKATEEAAAPATLAMHLTEGYDRYDLDELVHHQFSRYDCRTSKTGKTVSFRLRDP